MDVRVLAFHARYRCANAGACCTSSWPIPIEADRLARVRAAMATGAVRAVAQDSAPFVEPAAGDSDAPTLLKVARGHCVFHDPAGHCAIHSALGHDALPLACRQFPRVSVIDPRGVSVTLSHYCPTAAGLLEVRDSSTILLNPPAFPPHGEYVGLDARASLPPLLAPGMLMDWESWWEIERLAVETLVTRGGSPEEALGLVRSAVQALRLWRPEHGSLTDAAHAAFLAADAERMPHPRALMAAALDAIPEDLRQTARWDIAGTCDWPDQDAAVRRFLAAHAFANWTIHLGAGLIAWLRSIETALAFITAGAGVRHTDLVLRHLIDPKALADGLSRT